MTLKKNECEWNLWAEFCKTRRVHLTPLDRTGYEKIIGTVRKIDLWQLSKNQYTAWKRCLRFFLSSYQVPVFRKYFFSWMRIFFLFSLWSSIFAVIDRRLQKKAPGVCSQRFVSLIRFFMGKQVKARIFGVFRLFYKVMRMVCRRE